MFFDMGFRNYFWAAMVVGNVCIAGGVIPASAADGNSVVQEPMVKRSYDAIIVEGGNTNFVESLLSCNDDAPILDLEGADVVRNAVATYGKVGELTISVTYDGERSWFDTVNGVIMLSKTESRKREATRDVDTGHRVLNSDHQIATTTSSTFSRCNDFSVILPDGNIICADSPVLVQSVDTLASPTSLIVATTIKILSNFSAEGYPYFIHSIEQYNIDGDISAQSRTLFCEELLDNEEYQPQSRSVTHEETFLNNDNGKGAQRIIVGDYEVLITSESITVSEIGVAIASNTADEEIATALYNTGGQKVAHGMRQMMVGTIPPGVYILGISQGGENVATKISLNQRI